ncbi:MAG: hypothetical protein NZ709_04585 [Candidatus Marinimicrobia bacterium]|nr:hypothetical protein [Candidatus Neomarinimicrobiota bacterium]
MPGFYILLAFQYWLKKNLVPFKWTTVSISAGAAVLSLIRKMLKHGE